MQKLKQTIDKGIEWILITIMTILTLVVLWQVFTRFVLNDPSSWTEELAKYLLVWVSILGAAYVTGQRAHIAIDIVLQRSSPTRKKRLLLLIDIIVFLFALVVLVIGGINLVQITLPQISSALQIPLGYVYSIIPISGLIIMMYKLAEFFSPDQKSLPN